MTRGKKQEHEKGQYVQGTRKNAQDPCSGSRKKKDNHLMDCKYVSCLGKNKSIAKPRATWFILYTEEL